MENKNKFLIPEAIIVVFSEEDIITASNVLFDPLAEGDEGEFE